MNKLTAEQRLTKARIALMRNPKFVLFSSMLTIGKCEVVDNVSTACTNGRDEWWGRKFIESIDDKTLAGGILHENFHKVYRHMFVWRKLYDENKMLANAACDYVINWEIRSLDPKEEFVKISNDWCIDERFAGMNSKQVFELLKQQCKDGGKGMKGFDEHDWEGAEELTDEEKTILKQEIDSALRQGRIAASKMAGFERGDVELNFDDLLAPQVDWRNELRELAKQISRGQDASSWAKINRRMIGYGHYMPSMIKQSIQSIVLAIDTSGSISKDFLTQFMSEAVGLFNELNPQKVYLMYWGTDVACVEEYDGEQAEVIVQSTKPKGGGGTSPSCVLTYLQEHKINPDVTLVLTDGCIDNWGSGWQNTIWCVLDNKQAWAPEGKTVHISSED